MSIYVKIGKKILKNPNIIRPHVKTKDISELNFKKMKDMGMEKIMFVKDNVLIKLHDEDFKAENIIRPGHESLELIENRPNEPDFIAPEIGSSYQE